MAMAAMGIQLDKTTIGQAGDIVGRSSAAADYVEGNKTVYMSPAGDPADDGPLWLAIQNLAEELRLLAGRVWWSTLAALAAGSAALLLALVCFILIVKVAL